MASLIHPLGLGLAVLIIFITGCVAPGPGAMQTTNAQNQSVENPVTQKAPVVSVDSRLQQVAKSDNPEQMAQQLNIPFQNGMVKVRIQLQKNKSIPNEFNLEIESRADNLVLAWIDVEQLTHLAKHENVTFIRQPIGKHTYNTTT